MNPEKRAVSALMEGMSCSQAVLAAYVDEFGIDPVMAQKISAGFSGGLAQGLTCGAVAGGCMALGLRFASNNATDNFSRDMTSMAVQEFAHRFADRNGSHQCAELLRTHGMDMSTAEGREHLRESGLCAKMVEDAVVLIETIVLEQER